MKGGCIWIPSLDIPWTNWDQQGQTSASPVGFPLTGFSALDPSAADARHTQITSRNLNTSTTTTITTSPISHSGPDFYAREAVGAQQQRKKQIFFVPGISVMALPVSTYRGPSNLIGKLGVGVFVYPGTARAVKTTGTRSCK